MLKHITTPALVFGISFMAAQSAYAQVACGARDQLIERLATKFGEERVAGGLQTADQMVEVFTSPKTGSFTILLTRPNGNSCIVSTGKGWDTIEPTEIPAGSNV